MKKKYAFVLPYIGVLPSWFQLWLNSCENNNFVDWLLFTDDHRSLRYPENVKVHYCTFDDLRHLFQNKFDFPIKLPHPYKFCDFRPSYGIIFQDFLKDYVFWGHCDPDLIWGDLRRWLDCDTESYDRISHWGHCSLYKNTSEINNLYRNKIEGIAYYKDVYSNDRHIAFDEEMGMNIITRECGVKEFILPFFDVKPAIQSYEFQPTFVSEPFFPEIFDRRIIHVSRKGVVAYGFSADGCVLNKDFAYVHLQKRKMKVHIDMTADEYLIVPNEFIPFQEVSVESIRRLTPRFWGSFVKRQQLVWKSRCKFLSSRL